MYVFKIQCTHTYTHTHTLSQGNGTEEQVFEKRKVFKEDLKELIYWWTEKGSWFQADGAWEGILELQEKLEGIFELIPRTH